MKKSLVGLSAIMLLLLSGCRSNDSKNNAESTDKSSKIESSVKSSEQSTSSSSSKEKTERDAQKELSEEEVKNRVVAYFLDKQGNNGDVKFSDAAQSTWRELKGETVFPGFIDVNGNPTWNIHVLKNGEVTAEKSSASKLENQEESLTFNIFDVTDEQLKKLNEKNTRAEKLSDDEINKRLIAWYSDGNTIKPVKAGQISVYPESKVGWVDVAGTKVFTTTIYVSAEEMWNVEVTGNGNVYAVRYSSSYEPGSIFQEGTSGFNIFDITDEQLKKVDEAKTSNSLNAENIDQTELAQRLIVLLKKKVFPDSSIQNFEENGYINLNSEHGITYENVFYREGIKHQMQNVFTVKSNGDVAITTLQSGETVYANIFNDVSGNEWQNVRDNITEPPEDVEEG